MNILITELDKKQYKTEVFPNIDLKVVSRSGLHPTEINLLNQAIKESDVAHTLFINNRTGVMPIYLAKTYPDASINVLNIDFHHYKKVTDNLELNKASVNNLCASNYEAKNEKKLSQLFLQIDSTTYSKEYYQDIFSNNYSFLKKKGKIFISCDKRALWFEDFLRTHGISYSLEKYNKTQYVIILRKSVELPNFLDYDDSYQLRLPNQPVVDYYSVPGVFSHHRIDEGALALIDVVKAKEADIVIDMGCGIGTVGIAIAKFYNPKQTIFVDSNIRALDCAKKNVLLNEIDNCLFTLTDEGLNKKKATIFVGNPPYFSNFRIADLFIDNAYSNLAKGGSAYIVAKNIKHIQRAMLKVFGNANIIPRRGYNVIASIKT